MKTWVKNETVTNSDNKTNYNYYVTANFPPIRIKLASNTTYDTAKIMQANFRSCREFKERDPRRIKATMLVNRGKRIGKSYLYNVYLLVK